MAVTQTTPRWRMDLGAYGLRCLKCKLFPLRISGSTTAGRGWEGQTDP